MGYNPQGHQELDVTEHTRAVQGLPVKPKQVQNEYVLSKMLSLSENLISLKSRLLKYWERSDSVLVNFGDR